MAQGSMGSRVFWDHLPFGSSSRSVEDSLKPRSSSTMLRSPIHICLYCLALLLPRSRADAGTLVQFRTLLGDIEVEMLDQDKPVTVQNFLRYLNTGTYATNNMFLHRCLTNFIVQGGGFGVRQRDLNQNFTTYVTLPRFPAITNEFLVGKKVSNTYGTLAMAKVSGNPNSATSQWFFNLNDNSTNLDHQNGGFTVFGTVVRGTSVLDLFNTPDTFGQVLDLTFFYGPGALVFSYLPVTFSGPTLPKYPDLLFVDISMLRVRVSKTSAGSREIRWTSVNSRPNVVEYTTEFPPHWQTLTRVTGNGLDLKATDAEALGKERFYRVRIEY